MAPHLIRRAALMDKQQHLQQPPDGVLLLVAVANAGMLSATACENKEIVVMGDNDAPLGESIRDVIFVGSQAQQQLPSEHSRQDDTGSSEPSLRVMNTGTFHVPTVT